MTAFFIIGALSSFIFAMVSFISVKRHEKHDRILFSFSRLQSAVMKEVLARHDSGELTRKQYEASKFLMDMLDDVSRHYDTHKTTMFNLRKMRRMVEQDLARYEETNREMRNRLAEISSDAKIFALYEEFSRAAAQAFLAYTPFIRTEIILRLLLGDIAQKISQIRSENETPNRKFA